MNSERALPTWLQQPQDLEAVQRGQFAQPVTAGNRRGYPPGQPTWPARLARHLTQSETIRSERVFAEITPVAIAPFGLLSPQSDVLSETGHIV